MVKVSQIGFDINEKNIEFESKIGRRNQKKGDKRYT
jgi:hypothetical protein